ncbi:MAG: NifU family protein [Terracidiphilus sp.]
MPEAKREFTRRSDRIEELVARVESSGDPAMRAVAQELLQAVIELHGVALDRILAAVRALPEGNSALVEIAADELVSNVLSLHGINPVAIEKRVAAALETAQPYLHSHGGDVELTAIEDGVVHVRLKGTCGHCSSSSDTLRDAVEGAIYNAAPEIAAVIADAVPHTAQQELVILQTR